MAIFGAPPYGVGTPAVSQDGGGKTLLDAAGSGEQTGSRRIDPLTRDYVLDANGSVKGMNNVQQLVYLGCNTAKQSSAMRELGHEIAKIDRITTNFAMRVDTTLRSAVQHIVDLGLIEVVGTQVDIVRPGVARALLQWRDLSSGDDESTPIPLQPPEASIGPPPGPPLQAISTATTANATLVATGTSVIAGSFAKTAAAATVVATGTSVIAGSFAKTAAAATVVATGVSTPPPVLTSLNFDQADILGGDSIIITGTDLGSASACTVGGTSASITGNTSTTLTFTMPAKTAGSHNVQVTTPGGTSGTLPIEAWAPSTIGSTVKLFCEKPNYAVAAGTGTWATRVGTAPTEATVEPAATAGAPDFNGSGQRLAGGDNWSALATTTAGTVFAGLDADAETAAAALHIDDTGIVGQVSQGRVNLAFNSTGLRVGVYNGAAYVPDVQMTGSLVGAKHLVGMRWDGTTLRACVDSSTFSTNSALNTGPDTMSATLNIGGNYNLTDTLDGRIHFVVIMDTAISDANKTKMYKWARARHGTAA